MTDSITNNPEPMQSVNTPDIIPAEEAESLGNKYTRLAEEFRTLGQRQYETGLDPEEMVRKRQLDEMAGYGLFVKGQIESILSAKEKIYLDHCNVVSQELANPEDLSEEYRNLNRKSLDSGLRPEDLERWMHLKALAISGAFENLNKAA